MNLTSEQRQLNPKTINDIHLTTEQANRKEFLYHAVFGTGCNKFQAQQIAHILLQDELLGIEARTPVQQRFVQEFAKQIH